GSERSTDVGGARREDVRAGAEADVPGLGACRQPEGNDRPESLSRIDSGDRGGRSPDLFEAHHTGERGLDDLIGKSDPQIAGHRTDAVQVAASPRRWRWHRLEIDRRPRPDVEA